MTTDDLSYKNTLAVLATMHGKEGVIAPILQQELGLKVSLAVGINTDEFGTFSREVKRKGSQLDAARAKIAAGLKCVPSARVGIASEGSFGPHPFVPFLAFGRELVLMIDRETGFELIGYDACAETNFSHAIVHDLDQAMAFSARVRFPAHGLIVTGCKSEKPAPELFLHKEVTDVSTLEIAVEAAIRICGAAIVETDMRAHQNPSRMAAIERATRDLARRFHSRCPNCNYPGFDVTERIAGLPCAWCDEPTRIVVAEVLTCRSCAHCEQRPVSNHPTADPGHCDDCNP